MYITGDQLPIFSLFLTHLVAVWSWQLADLYCNIKANTSTYLSLSPQSGVQAVNKKPPELPILCLYFQLVPGDAHPLCQEVSAPGVSRPASSPFPLGVPRQCFSCGTSHWLPKRVLYPSPFPPISRSAGICCALSHRLILLISSGQCTLRILRRQLLMAVSTCATVAFVIIHVFAP